MTKYDAFHPTPRILLGPGPSMVAPRVLAAMSRPPLGYLDPQWFACMGEVQDMLRTVLGTQNDQTLAIGATGMSGMEACLANLIEPGDPVLIGVNGVFGTRMKVIAERLGAQVTVCEAQWGTALSEDALRTAAAGQPFKVVAAVHAETSTGVLQPLQPLRNIAQETGALLVVDAVTSVGGVRVDMDIHGIDALYSGAQKCLACPTGLAPVSFSERAVDTIKQRKTEIAGFYLDLKGLWNYWGEPRAYHHTPPGHLFYALHEGLRIVLEEGLEERYLRHQIASQALCAGLTAMGLDLVVHEEERLAPLTAVRIPDGIDDASVRQQLLQQFDLEIGGGLGPMKGKVWRIGLMGVGAQRRHVMLCLTALATVLRQENFPLQGDPLVAASEVWSG